jgi:GNAT superfamily N-acetyltransferase
VNSHLSRLSLSDNVNMNIVSPEITSSVSVRRLTVQDASSVAELSSQLGYPSSSEDLRQRLEQILRSSERIALGAVLNGQLVGWIDASVERHLQSPESVVIGGLVIRDQMRGFGIGKRLCDEIEQWTRSKSIQLLRVRSQVIREDAHRFYLREGYRKAKTSLVFEKALSQL